MRGENDRCLSLFVNPFDKCAYSDFRHGVETDGRFVEKQYRRIVQQGCRDLAPHSLPKTKLPCRCSDDLGKVKHGDKLVQISFISGPVNFINIANEFK